MTEQELFIEKVKEGAIAGWYEGKILPSVTIAQACLESGWGKSELATKANNLFGIKAKDDWKGERYTVKTAEYDDSGKKYYIDAAFRKYRTWQESLVDHAKFFHEGWREENYKGTIGETDYKKACKGLISGKYPYATARERYVNQLVGLIEMYKLDRFDTVAKNEESEVKGMTKFYYRPINRRYNFGGARSKSNIKFIALHWTANTSKGANAMAHYKYFQNNNVGASAHYFVDDENIVQIIGDSTVAYAVGGNQGYGVGLGGIVNENSISIEMCVNSDGDYSKMYFNTVELVKELLRQYPNAKVVRHWDATRKDCPHGYTGNNNAKWNKFLEEIKKPRRLILDLSKDSVAKEVGGNVKTENKSSAKKKCVMYYKEGNEITAKFIAQQLNVPCFKDNNKDLPNDQHDKWDILYIGDLGKDRIETAKEACKKFLGWKI